MELTKEKQALRFPLSPSTVLNCKRQLQYDLCNYTKAGSVPRSDFSTRQLLIFEAGHMTETLLANALAKIPKLKVVENKARFTIYDQLDGLKITGEIDRVLEDEVSGIKYLWDAKSINTRGFAEIKSSGVPRDKNYFQQQLYLHSDFIQEMGITKGILHYYNKDTSEDLMLEFDYNEYHALYALNQHVTLWKNRHTAQPRTEIFGKSWPCNKPYCPYHDFCYGFLYRQDSTPIEIKEKDQTIDAYKELDKLDFIKYLLARYGDSHIYYYQNLCFELSMLKTTIGLKVYAR